MAENQPLVFRQALQEAEGTTVTWSKWPPVHLWASETIAGQQYLTQEIILVAEEVMRGHFDHVLRVMLLSSVTGVFDHVATCHVVFLFLEILRKESMFFALVKNGRHLKTRATTCTKAPCKKT